MDSQSDQSEVSATADDTNQVANEAEGHDAIEDNSQNIIIELTPFQWRVLVASTSLLVLTAAVGIGIWVESGSSHWRSDPEDFRKFGAEVLTFFRQHDVNDDGALDLTEFEPLAHVLIDVNVSITYDLPVDPDDSVVTVGAHFQPIDLDSMQSVANKNYDLSNPDLLPLTALRLWTKPAVELKNFATKYFSLFLSKSNAAIGVPYHITPFSFQPEDEMYDMKYTMLSSNRYHPPRVTGDLIVLHNLLAMFHPSPFINSRFAPQGSLACLRAFNDEWLDISIRIHAEFQLQRPPRQPFWFTPAQFKGRLVISKDLSEIKYFRLYVPSNRRLNVDMEWLKNDPDHTMDVDIGYMKQMELRLTAASRPATYEGYDLRTSLKPETEPYDARLQDIKWTNEVQVDVCERAMELVFYPFKSVPYLNYTEAHQIASEQKKLVHLIALWGALDDQSC